MPVKKDKKPKNGGGNDGAQTQRGEQLSGGTKK